MTKLYRVHELVQFNYSDIGQYIDEEHTDRPLRNDILVDILNRQDATICRLNNLLESYVPMWVIEKVVNRRWEATDDEKVRGELEELLKELI